MGIFIAWIINILVSAIVGLYLIMRGGGTSQAAVKALVKWVVGDLFGFTGLPTQTIVWIWIFVASRSRVVGKVTSVASKALDVKNLAETGADAAKEAADATA